MQTIDAAQAHLSKTLSDIAKPLKCEEARCVLDTASRVASDAILFPKPNLLIQGYKLHEITRFGIVSIYSPQRLLQFIIIIGHYFLSKHSPKAAAGLCLGISLYTLYAAEKRTNTQCAHVALTALSFLAVYKPDKHLKGLVLAGVVANNVHSFYTNGRLPLTDIVFNGMRSWDAGKQLLAIYS